MIISASRRTDIPACLLYTSSPSSEEVQEIVHEIYDKKFGNGASEFTACCFLAWREQ